MNRVKWLVIVSIIVVIVIIVSVLIIRDRRDSEFEEIEESLQNNISISGRQDEVEPIYGIIIRVSEDGILVESTEENTWGRIGDRISIGTTNVNEEVRNRLRANQRVRINLTRDASLMESWPGKISCNHIRSIEIIE